MIGEGCPLTIYFFCPDFSGVIFVSYLKNCRAKCIKQMYDTVRINDIAWFQVAGKDNDNFIRVFYTIFFIDVKMS